MPPKKSEAEKLKNKISDLEEKLDKIQEENKLKTETYEKKVEDYEEKIKELMNKIEEKDDDLKNFKLSVETWKTMYENDILEEMERLRDIETTLLVGQVAFDFEETVRKNNGLSEDSYFNNLSEDIQSLFDRYTFIRQAISNLKQSRLSFAHPRVDKTLSKELFVETCIKKQICDEKDAKFIYIYSYEN
jgi:predicted  nucleic acid-binding Zn-ribbon protein